MKKIISLFLVLVVALSIVACGDGNGGETKQGESSKQPPDLTGEWKQINSNSIENYQAATITTDSIEIYWISDGGDTKSLYWAGSYVAPTTADEPYSWDSKNDKEKTETSLLASSDDIKKITYSNKQISYQMSALGTTTTVKLEKQ